MEELTCQIKEYIQPFERRLALQELHALTDGPIVPIDGNDETASIFSISHTADVEILRSELAYWHSVGDAADGLTTQLRSEATMKIARANMQNNKLREDIFGLVPLNLPNRRLMRYATHGLHEYRGKFFPQLVRALMNIARLPKDAIVLDPMCGSGTTLVEARLSGRESYGLDMNPLSVFITSVKCQALAIAPTALAEAYEQISEELKCPISSREELGQFALLTDTDQAYLRRWFSWQAILELDHIQRAIRNLPEIELRNFYYVALSNILRKVSWQKEEDLRVRKEQKTFAPGQIIWLFLREAGRSTRTVSAFLAEHMPASMGDYMVRETDVRQAADALPELIGEVDAIITSPPYATALPYIDTDRLSLIYLGLLPREHHNERDALMIGNREVTPRERKGHWAFYEQNCSLLPESTRALIERIDQLNKIEEVGFRRKNLSALLARYFFDMREAMQQAFALLRPGGALFLVVGNNRTTAGLQHITIETPDHLGRIASSVGFQLLDDIPMEMLASRDIFRKNAVPSEHILRMGKPQ